MSRARLGAALAALLACLLLAAPAMAQGPRVDARSWVLLDARDGTVLATHAAARRLPIASATKLMTAYVAMRELPLDRRVTAAPYDPQPAESLLGLSEGERISVRDLLYGLVLRSGNDAAETLAVASAGSVRGFVAQMNRYAAALGLANTHYANPVGLDDPDNYSSARDLATLAQRLLRDPVFARIADSRSALLRSLRPPERIESINDLLYVGPWVTGVKTGHTLGAGYVLVGSGARRGTELIAVTIGSPSEASRDESNLALLDYGFSRYERRLPVRRGQGFADPAIRYSGGSLPLQAARTVAVGLRDGQRLDLRVRAPDEVEGPIRRGARLGRALVYVDGARIATAPLVASRAIPAASDFDRARAFVGNNLVPILVAGFVILMVGVLLYRQQTRGNDKRGRKRVTAK